MDVLIIDRTQMGVGGIEVFYADLMEYAVSTGRRVIWLTTPEHEFRSAFPITSSGRVDVCHIRRGAFGPKYPALRVGSDDDVVMLTNEPCRYVISDRYRKLLNCRSFTHLLALPHYVGAAYYPETVFKGRRLSSFWRRRMGALAKDLASAGCVRGFSIEHLDAYEAAYGLVIPDKQSNVLPSAKAPTPFPCDEIALREGERGSRFEIVTCARFDFPHKGYILGLIRAFGRIHRDFPQSRLVVVGYGPGLSDVESAISELGDDAASSVELTGQLSPDKLARRYRSAQLNVGLAGALTQGALCGLPSIKMAHYASGCDGFGFIEHSAGLLDDSAPTDMTDLIESVITMPADDYAGHSTAAYETACGMLCSDPEYVFRQKSLVNAPSIPVSVAQMRLLYFMRLFAHKALGRGLFEAAPTNGSAD